MYITNKERKKMIRMLEKDKKMLDDVRKENLELRQQNEMLQEELNNMPQTIYDYYTDIVDTNDIKENIQEISKTYFEIINYLTNID